MAIPNYAKYHLFRGELALHADSIKAMLLTDIHTTDVDTQHYVSDINSNEVSGTNYTAGGKAISSQAVTVDHANNAAVFDADNITWLNVTLSNVRYLALYKDTGSQASSPVIRIIDLGKTYNLSAVDLTIEFNASGIIKIS